MPQSIRWARTCTRLLAVLVVPFAVAGCMIAPEELTDLEMSAAVEHNMSGVAGDQEPLPRVVGLYEAMARAIKYNLDHEVELAEQTLRERELNLQHFSLLPSVVASAGRNGRNNYNASNSVNIYTGLESLSTSTSQEKLIDTADIAFSWNIIDFGLSYVRARQAADNVLVQNELRRKVMQRIMEDVRTAYWKAASAQRLSRQLGAVEAEARAAESELKSLYSEGDTSPVTALTYEREIVEILRTIRELERDMTTAKAQLAALMNVSPDAGFDVVASNEAMLPPRIEGNFSELLSVALYNRPELREVEYRKRINVQEAHAALIQLLPGAEILTGSNFDSNDFLANNNWVNWGARASWNVMRVFAYPAHRDVIEQQDELLDRRALALTMAVMTQVYVSRARYAHALRELQSNDRYRDVQGRLVRQIRQEAAGGRVAKQTLVREELNMLVAEVKRDLAYAQAQNAYANVFASLGLDPYSSELDRDLPVGELSQHLRRLWSGLAMPGSWPARTHAAQAG